MPTFNPTAAQIAEHDRRNRYVINPDVPADAPRICEGCGCTDERPCFHSITGDPCSWVEGVDIDICSFCAEISMRIAEADENYVARRIAEPRVQLYSEGEANAEIRALRAGGSL